MANPGELVEYYQSKRVMCAICIKVDNKDNLHLRSEENREDRIHKSKALLRDKSPFGPNSETHLMVEWLKQVGARRQKLASEILLSELWELLVDESGELSLDELCGLNFPSPVNIEQKSSMLRALDADKTWFVRKGDNYLARTRPQVEEIQQRLKAESEKAADKLIVAAWLKQLWLAPDEGPALELPSDPSGAAAVQRYLTWIRDTAVLGNNASRGKEVLALLKELEISGKDAPFRILVKAGWWTDDEFVALHASSVSDHFRPEVVEAATLLAQQIPDCGPERVDLSALECFTIDDDETTEIDDALSIETLGEGRFRLGIHIADVAAVVPLGHPVDEEARHRATDVYLPERKFRMLPAILGDGTCSLVANQPRLAFSFLVDCDASGEIFQTSLVRSHILVRRRWSYIETDAALQKGGFPFPAILAISSALRERRQKAGAFTLPFGRCNLYVKAGEPEPKIAVVPDDPASPSQLIVSEMMVLANSLAGQTLAQQGCGAIFRSQAAPEVTLPTGPMTPDQVFKLRRHLRKGETGTVAQRHHGLGIDYYCQATSPIRRYGDLLMQRQLCAIIAGQPTPYSPAEIEAALMELAPMMSQAEALERERKLYWTLRYLEQRRHQEFDAIVLANFPDKHIIQLQPIYFETECPHVPGRPLPPGTAIRVRIDNVFPRQESLRVSVVLDEPALR